jgi:hypothetical protein
MIFHKTARICNFSKENLDVIKVEYQQKTMEIPQLPLQSLASKSPDKQNITPSRHSVSPSECFHNPTSVSDRIKILAKLLPENHDEKWYFHKHIDPVVLPKTTTKIRKKESIIMHSNFLIFAFVFLVISCLFLMFEKNKTTEQYKNQYYYFDSSFAEKIIHNLQENFWELLDDINFDQIPNKL